MKIKKILSSMIAASLLMCLGSCGKSGSGSDVKYITDKGKMIVGITEYAPMDFQDENGNWTGFDAEFAEAFGEKIGVDIEFTVIDWDNKFLELKSKSIDCIWNGMTISDEVLKNTECSDPYVRNEQVVVMKKDEISKYSDVESMKGLKFSVESASAGEAAAKGAEFNVVAVGAQSDALMEVQSGSVDACVIDSTMASAMTGEGTSYSDLGIGLTLTSEEYGVGFRKGSDMAEKFNSCMDELIEDGTLPALAEKYKLTLVK